MRDSGAILGQHIVCDARNGHILADSHDIFRDVRPLVRQAVRDDALLRCVSQQIRAADVSVGSGPSFWVVGLDVGYYA